MFEMFKGWLEDNFEEHEADQLMAFYRQTGEYPEEFLEWARGE